MDIKMHTQSYIEFETVYGSGSRFFRLVTPTTPSLQCYSPFKYLYCQAGNLQSM